MSLWQVFRSNKVPFLYEKRKWGHNMTCIYFVRHAEPNYHNHDDMTRELSDKGLLDRRLVTEFLSDKSIDVVLSSPYKRAVDTVKEFAQKQGLEIETVHDFRERRVDSQWIEDFDSFCRQQWRDFDYKLSDGETLREVQQRNISALQEVLVRYKNKNVVVGSHGTALSTIIHFYDTSWGYEDFQRIRGLMPWVVRLDFEGNTCVRIVTINLFENQDGFDTENTIHRDGNIDFKIKDRTDKD